MVRLRKTSRKVLTEGWKRARIGIIEVFETKFGQALRVPFIIMEPYSETNETIEKICSMAFSEQSNMGKLYMTVTGNTNLPDEVELEILHGKDIQIFVKNVQKGNRWFSQVVDWAPVGGAGAHAGGAYKPRASGSAQPGAPGGGQPGGYPGVGPVHTGAGPDQSPDGQA